MADHQKFIQKMEEDFRNELDEEQSMRTNLQSEKEEAEHRHKETIVQITDMNKQQKEELEDKYRAENIKMKEEKIKVSSECSAIKKAIDSLNIEKDELENKLKQKKEEQEDKEKEIADLQHRIEIQKKEITERDKTIGDKERRIYDLKKKNQELEKFKFVLDYKIKELKRDIGPRELEIQKMKDKTEDMDNRLKQ